MFEETSGGDVAYRVVVAGASGGAGSVPVEEQQAPLYEDQDNGRAKVSALATVDADYDATNAFFTQSAATENLVASACTLIGFNAYNDSVTDYWVQFHNTATTPAGAAAPYRSFALPAGAVLDLRDFGREEPQFSNGIAIAISTTHRTYTAGTATDVEANIQYSTSDLG